MAPKASQKVTLARVVQSLRNAVVRSRACPPAHHLLRSLPGLESCPPTVYSWLAKALEPRWLTGGEMLIREGEHGDDVFLIATGHIEVLRHVRERRAEPLALLGPSSVVGSVRLVRPGHRTASCVSVDGGWVFRLGSEAFQAMPQLVRTHAKVILLTDMATKLMGAGEQLVSLEHEEDDREAGPPQEPEGCDWDEGTTDLIPMEYGLRNTG